MIRMTTFMLALCSMLPMGHSFFFESSRTKMGSPVPTDAILRQNAAYPPEFHRYVKAQLAAGKGDELKVKFDFDVEAYAAAYDKKIAAQLEANEALKERKRRRNLMGGTPSPTKAPTAFVYSLPPTPSGSSVRLNADTSKYVVGVDFEQMINQKDANNWCRFQFGSLGWGVGQADSSVDRPYIASVLGGVDIYDDTPPAGKPPRYNQMSVADQIAEMSDVCEDLNAGPCWIGLFWKYSFGFWRWRGAGDTLDDDTANWAPNHPETTFLQSFEPDSYCAIIDDLSDYKWKSVDCIVSPTHTVNATLCYNIEYRPIGGSWAPSQSPTPAPV